MNITTKTLAGTAGSVLMLATMGTGAAVAMAQEPDAAPTADRSTVERFAENSVPASINRSEVVEGRFSFTQAELTPIDRIAEVMGKAPLYLCGACPAAAEASAQAAPGTITVSGAVEASYQATLDELSETGKAHVTMGCSCGGNPAGGLSSINAEVEGITVRHILERAGVSEGANTIVFTSSDGYEVALPLKYVTQRFSLIVHNVNGEAIGDSIGGVNQLWLGSTSARYFARDVVAVTLEQRETPPPAPGTEEAGDTYANLPNVSVQSGVSAL